MRPKLTIGMAVYDDFYGALFTLQSLRMHHDLREVELLVIDNKPDCNSAVELKKYCANTNVKYIPAPEVQGTSAPRNLVFDHATGEAVVCMDCHVMLPMNAIGRLKDWYAEHPETDDLISGPMLYDNLQQISTHFIDEWRGEMWGTWGTAWEACEGGDKFAVIDNNGRAQYISVEMNHIVLTSSAKCGLQYPDVAYAGHEKHLRDAGCKMLGWDQGDEFEIPGMGLGLFSCRKESWLGFNDLFRGFGGEEMYIHTKYRQHGRKCLCLGFLKWWHRFARPDGPKFKIVRWDKIRNYVLGHIELGLDVEAVHRHFVDTRLMDQKEWELLMENPNRPKPPNTFTIAADPTPKTSTIDDIYETVRTVKRDLDQHMPYLRTLAAMCQTVTEISKRRESLIAFSAGRPNRLISYNTEAADPMVRQILDLSKEESSVITVENRTSDDIDSIDSTDLLFIDSKHTYPQLKKELEKYMERVNRFAVFHDTHAYATKSEDGSEGGLLTAIREWVESHPQSFIYHHTKDQYGLTIIGVRPEDEPSEPIMPWPLGFGPGTELTDILSSIGVTSLPGCDCKPKAEQMDRWGVQGCRENFSTIVGWMREGAPRWKWVDKLKAAANAAKTGLAFQVNWTDPFPGIIEQAINRAESKLRDKANARKQGQQ